MRNRKQVHEHWAAWDKNHQQPQPQPQPAQQPTERGGR